VASVLVSKSLASKSMSHPYRWSFLARPQPRAADGLDMIFGTGMVNGALSRKARKITGLV
jgi:hypothetical protein